jgi:hypothetical protein
MLWYTARLSRRECPTASASWDTRLLGLLTALHRMLYVDFRECNLF